MTVDGRSLLHVFRCRTAAAGGQIEADLAAGVSGKCAVATKQLSSFPDKPDHGDLS